MVSVSSYRDKKPQAMRLNRVLSDKEFMQISVCQYLISHNSYTSQENLRQSLQQHGFHGISQATISRLLKLLCVVKIPNARGEKVYKLVQPQQAFFAACCVADMVLSIEHNQQFILIHTMPACAIYVAKTLEQSNIYGILGKVAGNDVVWISLKDNRNIPRVYQKVNAFFKGQKRTL